MDRSAENLRRHVSLAILAAVLFGASAPFAKLLLRDAAHDPMEHEHLHDHDEHRRHAHAAEDPPGEPHSHRHRYEPVVHTQPHYPDIHHRPGHE